jgi:hypothetical protein
MSETLTTIDRSVFQAMSPEGQLRVRMLEIAGKWKIVDNDNARAVVK